LPQGEWDSFAFIDACEAATRGREQSIEPLIRRVQAIEFRVLLDTIAG